MTSNPLLAGGFGILAIVVYILFVAVIIVLILRILYSVIWRGVRRGLREYHKDDLTPPVA